MSLTYEDLYSYRKSSNNFDNTLASTYEMHIEKDGDPADELTTEDKKVIAAHLKGFSVDMTGLHHALHSNEAIGEEDEEVTVDDIAEARRQEALSQTESDAEEEESDTCVRIALHIPAAHLSGEERQQLERDLVQEAAQFTEIWMQTREFRGGLPNMNEEEEYEEAVAEAEEGVDLPPEQVIADIAAKYNETYDQMRVDYDENFRELEIAVIECLIEDGYIAPGDHYTVRTETAETFGGDKTTFVTGPAGSKTVKGKKK